MIKRGGGIGRRRAGGRDSAADLINPSNQFFLHARCKSSPTFKTTNWEGVAMTERNEHKNEKYQDGDIYLNPCFGDLWVVDGTSFIKINNGYAIDLDEPEGFIKVGHIDGVINRRRTNDSQGCPSKSSS